MLKSKDNSNNPRIIFQVPTLNQLNANYQSRSESFVISPLVTPLQLPTRVDAECRSIVVQSGKNFPLQLVTN